MSPRASRRSATRPGVVCHAGVVSEGWYVVVLCVVSLLVILVAAWFVRHELRTRKEPPPAALMWLAYAGVVAVVVFGAARTSWVVLQ